MNPTTALMLTRAVEEDRRRVLRHPRRWLNDEPSARPEPHSPAEAIVGLTRRLGLAGSKP